MRVGVAGLGWMGFGIAHALHAGGIDAVLFDEQAVLAYAPHLDTGIVSSTLSPRYLTDLRNRISTLSIAHFRCAACR